MVKILLLFFIISSHGAFAQGMVRKYHPGHFTVEDYLQFRTNKKIPEEIRPQVLTALSHYPELRNIKIQFRIKKRKTPLTSRPRLLSIFRKKKNRRYLITISSETTEVLTPILFSNLPYNAQIGVLGHELAHISEYNTKNTFQLLGIAWGMLNSRKVDRFEWNTDKSTISHGLGFQLLDWSSYVRKALRIKEWPGASKKLLDDGSSPRERYMNPKTILEQMEKAN